MMIFRNLNENNINDVEDLVKKLKLENTAIDPFKQEISAKLDYIIVNTDEIIMALRQIFNGHILIDGTFKKIKI